MHFDTLRRLCSGHSFTPRHAPLLTCASVQRRGGGAPLDEPRQELVRNVSAVVVALAQLRPHMSELAR